MFKSFTNGRDLIQPAVTHFVAAYLTLKYLSENKESLMTTFASSKRKGSNFVHTEEGKKFKKLCMIPNFGVMLWHV